MQTVLVALNAAYTHSSLALRYLEKSNPQHQLSIAEFTINDPISAVYRALLARQAQVYCFSCYIWNIEPTLKLAQLLKLADPSCHIVLGGPEASYNAAQLLMAHPYLTTILLGEGERTLGQLLDLLEEGRTPPKTMGSNTAAIDLSTLPLPYTEADLDQLAGKLIYFETSRGCPFRCSYCLSAAQPGVRYFPMDYVERGFDLFFRKNVPLVKLIDRTFNGDPKRAAHIIRYIMAHSTGTCVHFEVEPQLLTPELIDLLTAAPAGMFQLEMGIQSANPQTLKAIRRSDRLEQIAANVKAVSKAGNMHIHLDLIAGLPYEDMASFERSFHYVYALRPHMLQLGFLKVLCGAPIQQDGSIVHAPFPPYEVLSTPWLSPQDVCRLKEVEEAVDLFYNSGQFTRTLEALTKDMPPFQVFSALAPLAAQKSRKPKLYQKVYELFGDSVARPLTYDFLQHQQGHNLPPFVPRWQPPRFKQQCYKLLSNPDFLAAFSIAPNLKHLRFEPVFQTVLLADYKAHQVYDAGVWFKTT